MSDLFRSQERLSAAKLNRATTLPDLVLTEAPTDGPGYIRQNRQWVFESECFLVALGDETSIITAGAGKIKFHMPFNMILTEVVAGVNTASSSGIVRFDVNDDGVSIFTTRVSIDANEETSLTAATPAVIANATIARGSVVTIDVDDAGTNAVGAKLYFNGRRG